jgi:hypothetical protein
MSKGMKAINRLLNSGLLRSIGRMNEIYREAALPCYIRNGIPELSSIGEEVTWLDTRKSIKWENHNV